MVDRKDFTEKNFSNQVLENAFPVRGNSMYKDTDRQEGGCTAGELCVVGLGCGRKRGWQGYVHCAKTFGLHVTVGSGERVWGQCQERGTRPGLQHC